MATWKVADAKARFSEVIHAAAKEPQIVCCRARAEAAIIGMPLFEELTGVSDKRQRPSIAELLSELREIQRLEPAELELPARVDRANPMEALS